MNTTPQDKERTTMGLENYDAAIPAPAEIWAIWDVNGGVWVGAGWLNPKGCVLAFPVAADAVRFSDRLHAQGIECEVRDLNNPERH